MKSVGGNPDTHILGTSFFTQLPLRYGEYVSKIGVVPASDNLKALIDAIVDTSTDPDIIRHEADNFFWTRRPSGTCRDIDAMPVEGVNAWKAKGDKPLTKKAAEMPSFFVIDAMISPYPCPEPFCSDAREREDAWQRMP